MEKRRLINDVLPLLMLTLAIVLLIGPFQRGNNDRFLVETSYSFPGETPVRVPDGTKEIARIAPGEEVMAYLPEEDRWEAVRVRMNRERSYSGKLYEIQTEEGRFQVSAEHLFPVSRGTSIENRAIPTDMIPEELTYEASGSRYWVQAENLKRGDLIPGLDGSVEIKNVKKASEGEYTLYSLELEDYNLYGVGDSGVAAADRSLSIYTEDIRSGGGGGCFPQGTLVYSSNGMVAIEEIQIGDRVYSLSSQGEWQQKLVEEIFEKPFAGQMMRIQIAGQILHATSNHPVLVMEGADLDRRPFPEDLQGIPSSWADGQWVSAGDLRVGDRVMTYDGPRLILSVLSYEWEGPVYNIQVQGNHNYLVGASRLLVHNKGRAAEEMRSADESMIMEDSVEVERKEYSMEETEGSSFTLDRAVPQESGLRAGYADDNQQYNYFINFLNQYKNEAEHFDIDVRERIIFKAQDVQGLSIPNAQVEIFRGDEMLCRGLTHADGSFYFFPSQYPGGDINEEFQIKLNSSYGVLETSFNRNQRREVPLVVPQVRPKYLGTPLDILFILDTTGSMGEEIQRLKDTIELIKLNLSSLQGISQVRFGLVLYKDRHDEYITLSTALTDDLLQFQQALDGVYASGGGDGPEDLQAALASSLMRMNWNPEAVKLAYIITDAPPHLDYQDVTTYVDSVEMAREMGVKIYSVGTGGLDINGEYVLRQISQFTGARYIFLTYGEQGESEGGTEGSVSHHTGSNYQTDKLESIIIQFSKEEMSHLLNISLGGEDPYYTARPIDSETREETLQELFRQACGQLMDYSSIQLEELTPTALMPFSNQSGVDVGRSEFLQAQLMLSLTRQENLKDTFALVDRSNLQQILEELKLQLSGLISEENSVRVGELMGAELILSGEAHRIADETHIFLKLLRVETGEILSITKVVVPDELLN